MRKFTLLSFLTLSAAIANGQQFALFGTKTMFDAFENPAQKSFALDSSKKFASNFFFPTFNIYATHKGSADNVIRKLANTGKFDTGDLPLGGGLENKLLQSSNIYLATFRIFSSYKYNQEIGFAWQLRTDGAASYTNETLAVLDSYKKFNQGPYQDVFNSNGHQQSYHQFSVGIRENWNKQLAFGLKLSLLSGIAYNKLNINNSYFYLDTPADKLDISVNGSYKGTFIYEDELNKRMLVPTFKNPGLSVSLGTTYSSKSGYFFMGNIKDLGFITWNKKSYVANFNTAKSITNLSSRRTNQELTNEILDIARDVNEQKRFITPTNAKADFVISKTFDVYKPSLIISKNLFHSGGDIAFVNTLMHNNFSVSLAPSYNLNKILMLGLQTMYKTPNFEFFVGTDNIGKSISLSNGITKNDNLDDRSYLGGSVYMGLGFKFGQVVNHPLNMSTMPGVNGQKTYKGFFKSIFDFFSKSK